MHTIHLVLGLGLGLGVCSGAYAAANPVTLQIAVTTALAKSPQVQSAREKLEEVQALKAKAWGAILPTISGVGELYGKKDSLQQRAPLFNGESYNDYKLALNLKQPLYTGGLVMAGISEVGAQREMAEADLAVAEREVALTAAKAFYASLVSERKIQSLLQTESVLKEHLKFIEGKVRVGVKERLEMLQARTEVALMASKIADARIQFELAGAELADRLGEERNQEIRIQGDLNAPDANRIQEALAQRRKLMPEAEKAEAQVKSNQNLRSITLAEHYPQLALIGSAAQAAFNRPDLLSANSTSWAFGMQLQVPIFSGLTSFAERRIFESKKAQLEHDLEKTRDALRLAEVKASRELEGKRILVETTERAFAISREALQEAKRLYRFGKVTFTVLSDSERRALDAELAWNQARHDYLVSMITYGGTVGARIQDLLAALNPNG